jgi:glycosyltransferase involved in cell wall biosynthesis
MATLRPGEMGGSENYARSLAAALARHGTMQYVCLVPEDAPDAAGGLPALPVRGLRGSAARRLVGLAAAAAHGRSLRHALPGVRAAHYPFTVPVPPLGVPAAVTLHDLLHRDLPHARSSALRAFRRLAYDRPARRAPLVIVPSGFVRERAVELLGVPATRVRVVHHGIDHERFRPEPGPREPFILYPAHAWPHKNHARLLAAFALVRKERPELRLVLTGGGHEAPRFPEGVVSLGLVSGEELASLYSRAAALVFPSLHEGFGLPPLEAMACGCPVACSNATSLPETCGDAAVYFDPRSPQDIAAGVLLALGEADRLRPLGLERARGFTWQRSARAHEEAYRWLVDGR